MGQRPLSQPAAASSLGGEPGYLSPHQVLPPLTGRCRADRRRGHHLGHSFPFPIPHWEMGQRPLSQPVAASSPGRGPGYLSPHRSSCLPDRGGADTVGLERSSPLVIHSPFPIPYWKWDNDDLSVSLRLPAPPGRGARISWPASGSCLPWEGSPGYLSPRRVLAFLTGRCRPRSRRKSVTLVIHSPIPHSPFPIITNRSRSHGTAPIRYF